MNPEDVNSSLEADEIMRMTTDIVASFVANNPVPTDSLPDLITSVHKTVTNLAARESVQLNERPKPAVPISRSITDDHIICLEDGKKLKMLKRYLRSHYGMTPEEYRKRWSLPADYPMVAPSYTKKRSDFAKKIGLGKVSGRHS
ncbi:MAG: transcriptional regulator [Ponticaulis sp.]|nr:transcriptional regulator [Ponticaulis sp.]